MSRTMNRIMSAWAGRAPAWTCLAIAFFAGGGCAGEIASAEGDSTAQDPAADDPIADQVALNAGADDTISDPATLLDADEGAPVAIAANECGIPPRPSLTFPAVRANSIDVHTTTLCTNATLYIERRIPPSTTWTWLGAGYEPTFRLTDSGLEEARQHCYRSRATTPSGSTSSYELCRTTVLNSPDVALGAPINHGSSQTIPVQVWDRSAKEASTQLQYKPSSSTTWMVAYNWPGTATKDHHTHSLWVSASTRYCVRVAAFGDPSSLTSYSPVRCQP